MNRLTKFIRSLAALLVGVAMVAPLGAGAGTYTDSSGVTWTSNGATITDVSTKKGTLTIPAEIEGTAITGFGMVFKGAADLVNITIPAGVTKIEASAFSGCSNLRSVTFVAGSQLASIGDYAFKSTALTSFTMPDTVTYLGEGAFSYCTAMKTVSISDGVEVIRGTTSGVGPGYGAFDGHGTFYGCTALTTIDWGSSVKTVMKGAFYGCSALAVVDLPASVEYVGDYAFAADKSLRHVSIPGNLTYLGAYAFGDCTALHYVDFRGAAAPSSVGSNPFNNTKARMVVYANADSTGWTGVTSEVGFPSSGTWQGRTITARPPSANAANPYDFYIFTRTDRISNRDYAWLAPVMITTNRYVTGKTVPASVATIREGDPVYLSYAFDEYWRGEAFDVTNRFTLAGAATATFDLASTGESHATWTHWWHTNAVPEQLQNLEPGEYTLTLLLNGDNRLKETDYSNNTTSITFTVVGTPRYTVTFDLNGASGAAPDVRTIYEGKTVGELPEVTAPAGWTFLGWYTAATGGTKTTASMKVTAETTLYAQWSKCDIGFYVPTVEGRTWDGSFFVTVTNRGVSAMTSIPEGERIYLKYAYCNLAGEYDMRGFINRFTLNSSTPFDDSKWSNNTLSGTDWGWGGSAWYPAELQNLAPGTYTLTCTLDATGALSETDEDNNTQTITFTVVANGTPTPPVTDYTVTFNANGGTVSTATRTVVNGAAVGELPTVTAPAGWTFLGWFTAADGGEAVTADTVVTGDVTYYAHWVGLGESRSFTDANGTVWKYQILNGGTETEPALYAKIIGDGNYPVSGGSIVETGAIDKSTAGELTIPSSIEGYPVRVIGQWAFAYCRNLTKVTVPDSVDTIEDCAFASCSGMESVSFGANVATIGGGAFLYCTALKTLTLPESVVTMGASAFGGCESLRYLRAERNFSSGCHIVMGAWIGGMMFNLVSNGIDMDPLWDCTGLSCIELGANVTEVCLDGFGKGPNLRSVICRGMLPTFSGGNTSYGRTTCYVLRKNYPDGLPAETWAGMELRYLDGEAPSESAEVDFFVADAFLASSASDTEGTTSFKVGEKVLLSYTMSERWSISGMETQVVNRITVRRSSDDGVVGYEDDFVAEITGGASVERKGMEIDCLKGLVEGAYVLQIDLDTADAAAETDNSNNSTSIAFTVVGVPTYSVAFSLNGAPGAAPAVRTVNEDDVVGELPEVAWSGRTFLGWYTAATGGTEITASTKVTANVTYYAHWNVDTPLPVNYTVTFNANGGSVSPATRTVTSGAAVGTLPDATRSGYMFAGWYTAASGGTKVSASTKVTANVTYYAHWTPNGGDYQNGDPMPVTINIVINNVTINIINVIVVVGDVWGLSLPPPEVRPGWTFVGWYTGENGTGTKVTTSTVVSEATRRLYAYYVKDDEPIVSYYLYDGVAGAVPQTAASVYDGYLYNKVTGALAGTIQVKAGKPKLDKKTQSLTASVKATVIGLDGKKKSLKAAEKGKAPIAGNGPTTVSLVGGDACVVTLGANGMSGSYGNYLIDGALNVFTSKNAADKAVATAVLGKWQGAVNVAWQNAGAARSVIAPYQTLSVTIANKGKAKVAGTLADGTKVSASSQLLVGDEWYCVPVLEPKKSHLAFVLWLPKNGGSAVVTGLADAVVGKPGTLKSGAEFHMDEVLGEAKYAKYLPEGLGVTVNGAKWVLPKAGKVQLAKDGSGSVDETKTGDNPSALKLTYTAKTGAFKGSFKAYSDVRGKPKGVTVKVTGVLVDGVGYGAATIKKVGGVSVTIK